MSSGTLARELVDYFLGERRPMPIYSLAKEYVAIAKFSLDWQEATSTEAVEAIRRAAELGLIDIRNEVVYPVEQRKPEQKQDTQMELF